MQPKHWLDSIRTTILPRRRYRKNTNRRRPAWASLFAPLPLEVLEVLQLTAHLNKPIGWLTLGLRQRSSVTLAMVQNPSLLLLDESFNGLDAHSAARLESILVREVTSGRLAVVMATHGLSLVERCCTTAVLLHDGRRVQLWDLKAEHGGPDLEAAIANALNSIG